MTGTSAWAALAIAAIFQAAAAGEPATPVSNREADQWLRWAVPLPKKASIPAKRVLPLEAIKIRLREGAGDVEQYAAQQLRVLLQQKGSAHGSFEILLGVCDQHGRLGGQTVPGAAELAKSPNHEQSYVIAPLGENQMALVGPDPRGVSYAARTLGQLLQPKIAAGKVELPLARVTDWPDLAERGIWWFAPAFEEQELDWFAGLKLNHMEILAQMRVEKGKPAAATIDAKAVERCRLRGIKMIPAVVHLEQLGGTGIFETYPETRGKGKFPDWASVICFSQPATQRVFDEWLTSLARTVRSDDVMVWFSENDVYCTCEKCKPIEQFQHEMQVVLHAWREARKARPKLRLRLLLTQGSYAQNIAIVKHAPAEVGITYYDGGRTYTVARQPMIYPALRQAMAGRWFGCYPTLCGAWYTAGPFAGTAYMKERLGELHQAGVVSLAGFAPPSLRINDFSLSAAAEFAWNTAGRKPRDFVLAWATRQRIADPEKVAQWWQLIEEPERNLYISQLPSAGSWSQLEPLLKSRQPARPGSGLLIGFPKPGGLDEDIVSVRKALSLAQSMPQERFVHETRYTLALLEAARAARDLTLRLSGRKALSDTDKKDSAALFEQIYLALEEAATALASWDRSLELYPGQRRQSQVDAAVDGLRTISGSVVDAARKLGLKAPFMSFTRGRIGSWRTGTFPISGQKVDHRIDVTDRIDGPGAYAVTFLYTQGMEALEMQRVALSARLPNGTEQEVAVDAHEGRTGAWHVKNQYTLRLKQYDPQARYTLVARLNVSTSQREPQRRTSQGDIYWQRVRAN
jgi:hypothetical protein